MGGSLGTIYECHRSCCYNCIEMWGAWIRVTVKGANKFFVHFNQRTVCTPVFFLTSPSPSLTTQQMIIWNQTRHSTCRTRRWQMELYLNSFMLPVPIMKKYTKAQVWWEKGKCSEFERESGKHIGDEDHPTCQHTGQHFLWLAGGATAVAQGQLNTGGWSGGKFGDAKGLCLA